MKFYNFYMTGLENQDGSLRDAVYLHVTATTIEMAKECRTLLIKLFGPGVIFRVEDSIPLE